MYRDDDSLRHGVLQRFRERRIVFSEFFLSFGVFPVDEEIALVGVDASEFGTVESGENGGAEFGRECRVDIQWQRYRSCWCSPNGLKRREACLITAETQPPQRLPLEACRRDQPVRCPSA